MVDMMLDFMLGPMRGIGDFYFKYQAIFNPMIVGFALYQIILRNRKANKKTAED